MIPGGANAPRHYEPEWAHERDEITGAPVLRLTGHTALSEHLYFTENAFVRDRDAVLFISDRDTPGTGNLFLLSLVTGSIERVTDYPAGTHVNGQTKTPDGTRILYTANSEVTLLENGSAHAIYHVPDGFRAARLTMTADGQYALVQLNESQPPMGVNYTNFTGRMVRIKRSLLVRVPLAGGDARVIVRDTHEGGHLQASPINPALFMFCHEGPWHKVNQRIYLGDVNTGDIWPCFRQEENDCVGHEFFTRSGAVFFDNRGPGHDGTITSSGTQAVAVAEADPAFQPYVGYADERGEVTRRIPMPYYLNHYHAGTGETTLVGDGDRDILRVDTASGEARLTTLCAHRTSWHGQFTHPHPTVSWDSEHVLFASDKTGITQIYMVGLY